MNAMKILQSVEELLYEVMSWLLFYPRTLLMTLRHPLKTMRYSDQEQADKPEKQYLETLSPPMFLVLSIMLAHGIEVVFGLPIPTERTQLGRLITESDQNLLAFRALLYSLCPLLFAWVSLKASGKRVDRESLRAPFFAQCYLSGALATVVGVATVAVRVPVGWVGMAAGVVIPGALLWYLAIQHAWLRRATGMGVARACAWTLGLCVLAFVVVTTVTYLAAVGYKAPPV